ncbi:nuclear transport factor 2 family protein [Klebsiella pneumoniae]|uniref:nuclear transport factor 2 family protein n=1 Tax=Klebsiella pneumoniae TaxID=573 RepID=UPI0022732BB0|nr:nuclear transport factor 2 family protein [Klebsiella pneumoniae]WRP72372.1 nuclear transport factor 2 family protein [Klebsiella pneumoniae]
MNDVAQVQLAAHRLVDAFSRNDASAYFASFTEDATFVFYNQEQPLLSRHAWFTQWTDWQKEGFSIVECISSRAHVQIDGDMAVFFHDVDTLVQRNGQQSRLAERETIIFRRTQQGWLACHEHLSARL